jgi:formate dehydrogenase major subunit
VASLAATFGRGAMTNGWVDIKNADVILAMGANPAENHPCGFKWTIEAKKTRNAKLVVVDPRFTRTASVADVYAPIRPGTDIVFLNGIIRHALNTGRFHEEYVKIHTNGPYIISDKYEFHDGLFSGFDESKGEYDKTAWAYESGPTGKAYKVDPTMKDPRCVFQLLKKHVDRYTPEMVEKICGTPKDQFLKVADVVTSTGNAQRVGTITYALGWTQHSVGVQIIRAAATLQLVLGNVGRPGGGVDAMRGHSNIQGATDIAGTFEILPGYLATPRGELTDLKTYLEKVTPTTLNKQAWSTMNYWSNYPRFMVSLLKAIYGKAATKENDWGYEWLPKTDGNYSWMYIFDDMYRGNSQRAGATEPGPEGFITFGMNPVGIGPNSSKMINALSKLKWMVVGEIYEIETATFWDSKKTKQYGGPDTSQIQTEVFQLPCAGAAEKDGSFINSARWIQWKWKAIDPPGEAKTDQEVLSRILLALRELYKKEGGALPEQVLNVNWNYSNPINPDLDEVLKEINGKAITDIKDKDGKVIKAAGQQLDNFGQLQDDGSTMCGNWLHLGVYSSAGNNAKRRNNADPTGLGMFHEWAFSWPANRRIMYNRAGADAQGRPWDPTRPSIVWNGEKWVGDVPDIKPDSPPGEYGAFIMLPEGVGRMYSPVLNDGPFAEHYEAVEAAIDNPLHPKVTSNPVSKKFKSNKDVYGTRDQFPVVCTTYRLTEHYHYWTHHTNILNQLQPGFFIEIPEELANKLGIKNGGRAKVTSARGSIEGVAMVTKRLRTLTIDGKTLWHIGFPLHWGYEGDPKHIGPLANFLTPSAMDPNTWTPEFKTFLVKVEKAEEKVS